MKTIQSLFLLWMMVSMVEGQSSCSLAKNFVKLSLSGKITECRPCPDCPEGHGLNIQCGSSITDDTKIRCVPCEKNKTYSNSHGVESCKPCQACGLRNVLLECTTEHNRKCGRKCPKGYLFDGRITDCRETTQEPVTTPTAPRIWPQLSSPTGGGSSIATAVPYRAPTLSIKPQRSSLISVLSTAIPGSIGVPLEVQNRSATSIESTTSIMPQSSSLYTRVASSSIAAGNMEAPSPEGNSPASNISVKKKKSQRGKKKSSSPWVIFGIIIMIILIVISTATVIHLSLRCRTSQRKEPRLEDSDESMELDPVIVTEDSHSCSSQETNSSSNQDNVSSGSAESLMASRGNESSVGGSNFSPCLNGQEHNKSCDTENDIPEDVGLADSRYDIEDFIRRLDYDSSPLQKNWKDVAKRFNIPPEDIQYLAKENNKLGGSAIRFLIEKLGSVCVSLKEFVDVLQELERHDVANDILKWFKNNKIRILSSV